jgi:hypothetical protein
MISRELTLPITAQKEVATNVLQSQQNLHKSLHQPSTPPTWLQLFQSSLQLLNLTVPINVTDCFLRASLQRPLLAAVPINASSSIRASPALRNSSCTPPLPSVPLWEPDFTQVLFPQVLFPHTPAVSCPWHLGPTFLSPVIPISRLQNNWHPPPSWDYISGATTPYTPA